MSARGLSTVTLYRTREADDAQSAAGAWRKRAACWDAVPWLMFETSASALAAAEALCRRCPVQAQCLEYALLYDEEFGMWGGMSAVARRALSRRAA